MSSTLAVSEIESPHQPIAANTGTLIQLQQVEKYYKEKHVLKGVTLNIPSGQFVAFVGRSGCGKSTLLRLIAGLERHDSGKVLLEAKELQGIRQDTTVMFQDSRLLPWKKVIDNVGLGLTGPWQEQARNVLEEVGLADRQLEWPSVLSGGQQQRVALARALVRSPKLLLLDEPLSALDALTRLEMQLLIERLWIEQRFTTLLVTHDVTEAIRLADRIILIEEGTIALDILNPVPRPRLHSDPSFAALEKQVLDRIMNQISER